MIHVVIPYGGDDPHRDRALEWVTAEWAKLGYSIAIGIHNDGPWCKAKAVAVALDAAAPADNDILIIADADVWPARLQDSLRRVVDGANRWAMAHRLVVRFNEEATRLIYDGMPFSGFSKNSHDQRPYNGTVGGGCVIIPAIRYRQVPLDPRFAGWGQEDESWGMALTTMFGQPYRGGGDLYHLWHPAPDRRDRVVGSNEGEALRNRYRLARGREQQTMALLDEFREAPQQSE